MALGEYPEKVPELYRLHALPGGDAEAEFPTFKNIAPALGIDQFGMSGSVVVDDFTGDGKLEIITSSWDPGKGLTLYQLDADGNYQDRTEAMNLEGISGGLNIRPADFDNDGDLDLLILRRAWLEGAGKIPNSLLRNDGVNAGGVVQFTDITFAAGLAEVSYPTSTAEWADLDLDGDLNNNGYPDIYLGTGSPNFGGIVPNLLLMNEGGEKFIDRTAASGMGHLQKGHGVSFTDIDGDGNLEVFEQMGGAFPSDQFFDAVFENPGFGNHWLEVRLKGVTSNSYDIGCRVWAVITEDGAERSVYTWLNSGGSFGANRLIAHLGLGKAEQVDRLEVFWPMTGITQSFDNIDVDQFIVVTEGEKKWRKP